MRPLSFLAVFNLHSGQHLIVGKTINWNVQTQLTIGTEELALSVFLLICAQGYFQNTPAAQLICVPMYQQLLSRTACRYDIATFLSPRPLTRQKCAHLRNILISPSFAWLCTLHYLCIKCWAIFADCGRNMKLSKILICVGVSIVALVVNTVTIFVSHLLVLETGRLKDQLILVRLLERNVHYKNQSFKVTY